MTKLLIGIDASRAVRPIRTGTEHYSWAIIRELIRIDTKNRYRLYAPHLPKENIGTFPHVEWKILPQQRLWSQVRLAQEVKKNPPDLLFVPAHVVPLLSKIPTVVTIHGLEYVYSPQSYSSLDRRYLNFSTGVSLSKAKKVIVPSQQTKKDILKYYRCPAAKIVPIPLAYNEQAYNPHLNYGARPIKEPYIFFIGRLEERKNISFLLDAFTLLSKENKPVKLVLAGKSGYGFEKIRAKIDSLPVKIREAILLPGYLPLYDAARYLKHASVFAFPSLYEGFGLPILEAMAIGTPVIASNTSSLPEVAGEGAVLLPPENPLTWAATMSRIIHQPDYAEGLRKKGFKQAAQFSWQHTAEATLKVLEDVGHSR